MQNMSVKRFTFAETVPLTQWDDGSIRVIGSRVILEVLVHRFQMGDTLEEIHESYPSVTVRQIDAIISWYLNHKAEADEYIREGEVEAEKVFQEIQSRPGYKEHSERLRRRIEQFKLNRTI